MLEDSSTCCVDNVKGKKRKARSKSTTYKNYRRSINLTEDKISPTIAFSLGFVRKLQPPTTHISVT